MIFSSFITSQSSFRIKGHVVLDSKLPKNKTTKNETYLFNISR